MKKLIFALLPLLPVSAYADNVGPKNLVVPYVNPLIDAQTLDANRSFTLGGRAIQGYGLLVLSITVVDANNSIGNMEMSCSSVRDTDSYILQSCTVTAGDCDSDDATWSKNPNTGTTRWPWRVDVEGYSSVTCTFTPTGGEATDTITVKGDKAVKGGG